MNRLTLFCAVLAGIMLVASGCSKEQASSGAAENRSSASLPPDASSYRLAQEPAGASDVKAARSAARDGEDVVVVGRIGGDRNPWVEGAAAFTIVDLALKPCTDGCDAPWDYCCELGDLPTSKALVKIVDNQGQAVNVDSRTLLGVKELQTVVSRGKAKRDEAGNLTILASGIFIRH